MAYRRRMNARGMATSLPIPIIQCIQSFLTVKEAARSSVLSKSWYDAWLARPDLILDQQDFRSSTDLAEFVAKTVGRYEELNINISRLKLYLDHLNLHSEIAYIDELIKKALKICGNGMDCEFFLCEDYVLPSEVLGSERIVRLSLFSCEICRPPGGRVECSRLKSLKLVSIQINDDAIFSDSFPSLKDLSILCCYGYKELEISGTSIELITILEIKRDLKGKFNVPNICKFIYRGRSFPSLSLKEVSREWESKISITHSHYYARAPWFDKLKVLLEELSKSMCKVSLNVEIYGNDCDHCSGSLDAQKVPKAENLTLSLLLEFFGYDGLLGSVFMNCHPKYITQEWFPKPDGKGKAGDNELIKFLCMRLIKDRQRQSDECGYDYLVGVKDVNVEIFEVALGEWIPLPWQTLFNGSEGPEGKQKIRFRLDWD